MIKKKIIFWGYSLHSDTLGYVWRAMKNSFDHLGYETFWFTDDNYISGFDYSNCVFITEGKACNSMPFLKDCTYIVHYCHQPERFLGNVGRLIDMRYLVDKLEDPTYSYVFDENKCEKLESGLYYENSEPYEKIYISWATNLLPHEINLEDRFIKRKPIFNFVGSIGPSSQYGQADEIDAFIKECRKNNIEYKHYNPWSNPQTDERVIELVKESYLAPDFRGPKHKDIGVKPCRLFKNISYGQIGLTNSKKAHEFLEETTIYNESPQKLFYDGVNNKEDYDLIKKQMQLVKEKHTYINRVKGIIKIL